MTNEIRGKYSRYRKLWKKASAFQVETRTPIHIDFELNYSCNLRCRMCPLGIPYAPKPSYAKKLMPFSLFKKVIDEGVRCDLMAIRLSQIGEPLLRKDLPNFINYARKKGIIDILINTNGMLLNRQWAESLIESGVTQLRVSIDAITPSVYRKVRVGGDYNMVIRNVNQFLKIRAKKKIKLPILRVSFIRTRDNEHQTKAFIKMWKNKADYIAISDFSNWVASDKESKVMMPKKRIVKIHDFHCEQPWQRATIFANGDLIPCCSEFFRNYPLGNVKRESLRKIWMSSQARKIRLLHKSGEWSKYSVCRICINNSFGVN